MPDIRNAMMPSIMDASSHQPPDDDYPSGWVIVYSGVALSGFVVGIFVGWLIWG